MKKEDATAKGVEEAWAYWMSQHDVTVPDCIIEAIKIAFSKWLDKNEYKVIAAIADKAKR